MNENEHQQLIDFANAHIEGKLDAEQREQLEALLTRDNEARRVFVDFMHDHAALHWEHIGENGNVIADFPQLETAVKKRGISSGWLVAAAAIVISGIAIFAFNPAQNGDSAAFATMETTRAARWESGDLPTVGGARLTTGTLRLAEGLATLRFDSGAEVILEAPAEIELINRMNCQLTRGTVVANIPESAIGFRIKTPAANVVDYGTRFAVNVDKTTGATKTQVFEGLVEVEHPESGKIVELKSGQRNFVAGDSFGKATDAPNEGEWTNGVQLPQYGPEWSLFPTNRDTYVHSRNESDHVSDIILLLKNTDFVSGPNRKTYLGFDLSVMDRTKIADAELILNFTPTGWGLASRVPDSEFTVYGLVGGDFADWSHTTMTWENAPANIVETGDTLQPAHAKKLGTFMVQQGIQRGRFGISGKILADFLKNDSDGNLTLVIVRNTLEIDIPGGSTGGLVHGIASRRHPALPAPTLAIRVVD